MDSHQTALLSQTMSGSMWNSTFQHPSALPDELLTLTPQEFELTLRLSVDSLKTLRSATASNKYEDTLRTELSKLSIRHEKEKSLIEKSLAEQERTHAIAMDRLRADSQKRIQTLEGEVAAAAAAYTTVSSKLGQFDALAEERYRKTLREQVESMESRHANELKRTLAAHTAELERSERTLTHLQTLYSEKEDKLRKESEHLQISSEIGKQGEKEFEELCAQHTKWGTLTNTSKMPHATDRSCLIRECNTLFEVKNYSTPIPQKEVTKFISDVKAHSEFSLGIFISLKTEIPGKCKRGFVEVEWTEASQMLVYINSFYSHPTQDIFAILEQCVDIARTVYTRNNTQEDASDSTTHLQGRIDHVKEYIERQILSMTKFMSELKMNKKTLLDTVTKQHTSYLCQVEESKHALLSMVRILLNSEVEAEPIETPISAQESPVVESAIPVVKKSRARPKKTALPSSP